MLALTALALEIYFFGEYWNLPGFSGQAVSPRTAPPPAPPGSQARVRALQRCPTCKEAEEQWKGKVGRKGDNQPLQEPCRSCSECQAGNGECNDELSAGNEGGDCDEERVVTSGKSGWLSRALSRRQRGEGLARLTESGSSRIVPYGEEGNDAKEGGEVEEAEDVEGGRVGPAHPLSTPHANNTAATPVGPYPVAAATAPPLIPPPSVPTAGSGLAVQQGGPHHMRLGNADSSKFGGNHPLSRVSEETSEGLREAEMLSPCSVPSSADNLAHSSVAAATAAALAAAFDGDGCMSDSDIVKTPNNSGNMPGGVGSNDRVAITPVNRHPPVRDGDRTRTEIDNVRRLSTHDIRSSDRFALEVDDSTVVRRDRFNVRATLSKPPDFLPSNKK